MALVPVDKRTGKKRSLSEQERARLCKEREKADHYNRNRSAWRG